MQCAAGRWKNVEESDFQHLADESSDARSTLPTASLCWFVHGATCRPTLRSTSLYYDVVVSSGSLMSLAEAK